MAKPKQSKKKTITVRGFIEPWCGIYSTARFKGRRIKGRAEGGKMDSDIIPCTITFRI
jgi:hypothetical protein